MAEHPPQGSPGEEDAAEGPGPSEIFEGLTGIDVVDGELLPRRPR